MRRFSFASAALVCALIVAPLVVRADQLSDLKQQLAVLLAQIAALQAQQGTSSPELPAVQASAPVYSNDVLTDPSSVTCYVPLRSLALGNTGQDVRTLQQYLVNRQLLSVDAVTGYFGSQTEVAVQAWQAQSGIVSGGSPATTGFGVVGPKSTAYLRSQCAPGQRPEAYCNGLSVPANTCATSWESINDALGCTVAFRCPAAQNDATTSAQCQPVVLLTCPTGSVLQMTPQCAQYCSTVVGSQ